MWFEAGGVRCRIVGLVGCSRVVCGLVTSLGVRVYTWLYIRIYTNVHGSNS